MKNRGFTLIELLVVVTIIALLVAILVPSLTEANRIAKMVVCSTHLKQIALGINLYTIAEPLGLLPSSFRWNATAYVQTDPAMPGYYFRHSIYGGPAGTYESWMDFTFPYVDRTLGLFACPAFQDPSTVDPDVFAIWKTNDPSAPDLPHPPSMHYGYNLHIGGRGNPTIEGVDNPILSLQLAQVSRPSDIALVLDYRSVGSHVNWWNWPGAASSGYGESWDPFRAHGGIQTNMCFVDQHVEVIDRFDPDYFDFYHWDPLEGP